MPEKGNLYTYETELRKYENERKMRNKMELWGGHSSNLGGAEGPVWCSWSPGLLALWTVFLSFSQSVFFLVYFFAFFCLFYFYWKQYATIHCLRIFIVFSPCPPYGEASVPLLYYCVEEISCATEIYSCSSSCENPYSETVVTSAVTWENRR